MKTRAQSTCLVTLFSSVGRIHYRDDRLRRLNIRPADESASGSQFEDWLSVVATIRLLCIAAPLKEFPSIGHVGN
jgi:hypothetical protein